MENKGQGALEYLLLIGGAVLVAVIVIVLLTTMTNPGEKNARISNAKLQCLNMHSDQASCNAETQDFGGDDWDIYCCWDTGDLVCSAEENAVNDCT